MSCVIQMQPKVSGCGVCFHSESSSEISLKLLEEMLMFQTHLVPESLSSLLLSNGIDLCELIPKFYVCLY